MADTREAILARLEVICAGIEGVTAVERNKLDLTGLQRPGVIIYDGSEQMLDQPPSQRRATEVARMELSPKITFMLRGEAHASGALMSLFRARLLVAVINDADLLALTRIRFDGCIVPEPLPESREPRIEVNFVFTYSFRISDL